MHRLWESVSALCSILQDTHEKEQEEVFQAVKIVTICCKVHFGKRLMPTEKQLLSALRPDFGSTVKPADDRILCLELIEKERVTQNRRETWGAKEMSLPPFSNDSKSDEQCSEALQVKQSAVRVETLPSGDSCSDELLPDSPDSDLPLTPNPCKVHTQRSCTGEPKKYISTPANNFCVTRSKARSLSNYGNSEVILDQVGHEDGHQNEFPYEPPRKRRQQKKHRYHCLLCDSLPELNNINSLAGHIASKHIQQESSEIPCSYCEARFTVDLTMPFGEEQVHAIDEHMIEVHRKCFDTQSCVQAQQTAKQKLKCFLDDSCNLRLTSVANLQAHIMQHLKNAQNILHCNLCDEVFNTNSNCSSLSVMLEKIMDHFLDNHAKAFSLNSNSTNTNETFEKEGIKLYLRCVFCSAQGVQFPDSSALRSHIRDKHITKKGTVLEIKCPFCEAKYSNTSNVCSNILTRILLHIGNQHPTHLVCNGDDSDESSVTQLYEDDSLEELKDYEECGSSYNCISSNVCSFNADSRWSLCSHLLTHEVVQDNLKMLKCKYCDWEGKASRRSPKLWLVRRLLDHLAFSHYEMVKQTSGVVHEKSLSGPMSESKNVHNMNQVNSTGFETEDNFDCGPLTCIICSQKANSASESFQTFVLLLEHFSSDHMQMENDDMLSITCCFCSTSFKQKAGVMVRYDDLSYLYVYLVSHLVLDHGCKLPDHLATHRCERCCYETLLPDRFAQHQSLHMSSSVVNQKKFLLEQGLISKQVICDMCGIVIKKASLGNHKKFCSKNEASKEFTKHHPCPHCGKQFYFSSLNRHIKTVHADQKDFPCSMCPMRLVSRSSLSSHEWKRHRIVPDLDSLVNCNECDAIIPSSLLNSHKASHRHRCLDCHVIFTTREDLLEHSSEVHKRELSLLYCDLCPYSTNRGHNMKLHSIRKHGVNKLSCQWCNYLTDAEKHLNRHIQTKHPNQEKLNVCSDCKKHFSSKNAYENHMYVKHSINLTNRDVLRCEYCKFVTLGNSLMKAHLQNHINGGSFQCKLCKTEYASKKKLLEHKREMHLVKTLPLSCNKCSHVASSKHLLKAHMERVHDTASLQQCELCDFSVQDEHKMIAHLERFHPHLLVTPVPPMIENVISENFLVGESIEVGEITETSSILEEAPAQHIDDR